MSSCKPKAILVSSGQDGNVFPYTYIRIKIIFKWKISGSKQIDLLWERFCPAGLTAWRELFFYKEVQLKKGLPACENQLPYSCNQ